ncbi:hypothetical protein M427DRAFT_371012 [Gonapodya prolifera JEL478]|uniref:Uncharacterized protein n=1 Tax=Gonapodya prolifera (strain JEL478) TaxID=1344416 RepID=A0A139A985_GONPJ|nr:hypothetical protein M427DRAFT_371012 [Gonapodya prolifera JEL478]|eukprot:KXS13391.1 hypothetical protein M427DRAFT_371012 [Gonapodya prolifera JEL478]
MAVILVRTFWISWGYRIALRAILKSISAVDRRIHGIEWIITSTYPVLNTTRQNSALSRANSDYELEQENEQRWRSILPDWLKRKEKEDEPIRPRGKAKERSWVDTIRAPFRRRSRSASASTTPASTPTPPKPFTFSRSFSGISGRSFESAVPLPLPVTTYRPSSRSSMRAGTAAPALRVADHVSDTARALAAPAKAVMGRGFWSDVIKGRSVEADYVVVSVKVVSSPQHDG